MNSELRKAQAMLGQPSQEPAYMIAKFPDPMKYSSSPLYWDGSTWTFNMNSAKLYPSIKSALADKTVPPAITEVIRHS